MLCGLAVSGWCSRGWSCLGLGVLLVRAGSEVWPVVGCRPARLGGCRVSGLVPGCWVAGCGTWVLVWGVWVWGCLGFWCVVVVVCVRGLGGGVMVVCVVWLAVGLVVVALVPPGPPLVLLLFLGV